MVRIDEERRGECTNAANLHASAGKSAEGGLGTRSGGLCAGTSSGAELDVEGVDAQLLIGDVRIAKMEENKSML